MTPKHLYDIFKKEFAWFIPHVVKYKSNRKTGGIDIYLDSGDILNFQADRTGWLLKRSDFNGAKS